MKNWAGNYTYRAASLEEPESVEALQRIVAGNDRVRALGTRHSFNDLADTPGVLVDALSILPAFELDEERRIASFGGGTRFAAVARFLTDAGWALHNMGSLPHISVAGAVSTATHGSGVHNGNLATAVRGVQIAGPDGALRWIRQGEEGFEGSVVALGLLGVVVRVEVAIQPTYLIRQDVYGGLDWDVLLADFDAVAGAGYSVSVFTDWVTDPIKQVWVKRRLEHADDPVPDELFGATRDTTGTVSILDVPDGNTTAQGVAGPWSAHLPHFRIDSQPSLGDEIQSEYFIARSDAAAALTALRAIGPAIAEHLLVSELRTIAADELWLSTAYRRDSLALHFTWKNVPEDVLRICSQIEAALAPFTPRPHWGKVHTMEPAVVAAQYPRFADFQDLVRAADPDGKFAGRSTDALMAVHA